ncbi:unnamed protein product [Hermetia illucens]|uniref:WAP domain-containing protein n=1 Tax=Hermetia illucens TaxID=343691 RepID=A0A7R8YZH1_HERIL|nr:WAP four-disulfide core domain protein 18-like [Hermetia illucens]CAD7089987.1 unnamed protein product [Hermetia illucens]
MAKPTIFLFLLLGLSTTIWPGANGQFSRVFSATKPGSCPPARDSSVCIVQCNSDMQCAGRYKCCPTSCGAACTIPVTQVRGRVEKEGQCPKSPEGPWVCTSRCSQDGDCRRNLKCCRNRCGALACQRPEFD